METLGTLLGLWIAGVLFYFFLPWSIPVLVVAVLIGVGVAMSHDGGGPEWVEQARNNELAERLWEHEDAHREITRELLRRDYDDALRRMDEIIAKAAEESGW